MLPSGGKLRLEYAKKDAGGNSRADDTGDIRSHRVLQEEVRGIFFLPDVVDDPGGIGNGGNTGRTDQGVDRGVADEIHQLGEEDASCGGHGKGQAAENKDEDRLTG